MIIAPAYLPRVAAPLNSSKKCRGTSEKCFSLLSVECASGGSLIVRRRDPLVFGSHHPEADLLVFLFEVFEFLPERFDLFAPAGDFFIELVDGLALEGALGFELVDAIGHYFIPSP